MVACCPESTLTIITHTGNTKHRKPKVRDVGFGCGDGECLVEVEFDIRAR